MHLVGISLNDCARFKGGGIGDDEIKFKPVVRFRWCRNIRF